MNGFTGKIMKKEADVMSKRRNVGEKIVYCLVFMFFAIHAFSLVYPLFYLLINSLQSANGYFTNLSETGNAFAFPRVLHWKNYRTALDGMSWQDSEGNEIYLTHMFFNSMWYTLISSSGGLMVSAFSAYTLSRYKFVGRNFVYGIAIFTMTVPIIGSTGASFKLMSDLGIYNSPLFLVTAFGGLGFNFLILYGFFKNLSWNYAEAVFIDGGGNFTAFFRIMLPQAKAPVMTLFLMAAIGAWNDYMTPLLYLPDYPTIASGLYQIQIHFNRSGNVPAFFAGLIMSITPVIILFACFSDSIMKNFAMGGLKG